MTSARPYPFRLCLICYALLFAGFVVCLFSQSRFFTQGFLPLFFVLAAAILLPLFLKRKRGACVGCTVGALFGSLLGGLLDEALLTLQTIPGYDRALSGHTIWYAVFFLCLAAGFVWDAAAERKQGGFRPSQRPPIVSRYRVPNRLMALLLSGLAVTFLVGKYMGGLLFGRWSVAIYFWLASLLLILLFAANRPISAALCAGSTVVSFLSAATYGVARQLEMAAEVDPQLKPLRPDMPYYVENPLYDSIPFVVLGCVVAGLVIEHFLVAALLEKEKAHLLQQEDSSSSENFL